MRRVTATRYVTPLREGGSLPGLVEADDDGLYVVKFRSAGQGPKALVAEVIAGELGRALGLLVPDLVLVDVDPELARAEPDIEVQELIEASGGLNAGLDFLPGALPYLPGGGLALEPDVAAAIVWFDAFVSNVDRTPRNTNLLLWHSRLWLIDHGAALYPHHGELQPEVDAQRPFELVRDHVLLPCAGSIADVDAALAPQVTTELLERVVGAVPDAWLDGHPAAERALYVDYLAARVRAPRAFAQEAERARAGA
jgi:HipA-like protein